jgi:GNAT superfamily N-acetyltransferase
MTEEPSSPEITIRRAYSKDADGITRIYLESADYHAGLDVERYSVPASEGIAARYREGRQHPLGAVGDAITLLAEVGREIVGFVDVRLTRSPDPMHRAMLYCHVVEIAVSSRHQGQGIGGQLLRAAEDWGRQQGAEFASLEYLAANKRAGLFYERLGYHAASVTAIKRL